MHTISIDGLDVHFPFEPYHVQVEYMRGVAKALSSGGTGLLESPTGTGKTLCLLCVTLAWVQQQKSQVTRSGWGEGCLPKIIYCSRTHSQLGQVIRELRSSPYRDMKTALLGSREHFCVNTEVSQLPNSGSRTHACLALRSENRCRYFNALQSFQLKLDEDAQVMDMEDLILEGKKNGFCPYYSERERTKNADIVFMPYNYVINPSLRKQLPFPLQKNCVLIVDEAHNLPSVLSDEGCTNLSALSLATAIQDCSRGLVMLKIDEEASSVTDSDLTQHDIAALKIVLKRLEDRIEETVLQPSDSSANGQNEFVRDASFAFIFLETALISREVFVGSSEAKGMKVIMEDVIKLLSKSEKPATGMAAVNTFLSTVFDAETEKLQSVKFVVQEKHEEMGRNRKVKHRTVGFWRLDSTEMERLQSLVHSLILTSGTLSPLDHFAAELCIRCDVKLKGSHVIQSNQLVANILMKGPGGEKLNGSYSFRASSDYRMSIGMTVVNICRHVPGGSLVFFPSYSSLYATVDLWRAGRGSGEERTIWGMLNEWKQVFIEPSESSDLSIVVEKFKEVVDTTRGGAILLAVCRGKISEGVNFSDHHGRCVMVTGIPYANHGDLYIRLKRAYLTEVAPTRPRVNGRFFTGEDWYRSEALRAVSQCVGRVIRHKDDYGAIVFADERYKDMISSLPEWIAPSLTVSEKFGETYGNVVRFFSGKTKMPLKPENKLLDIPQDERHCKNGISVPIYAEKAREFFLAQKKESLDFTQLRQKRRLEDSLEVPQKLHKSVVNFHQLTGVSRQFPGLSSSLKEQENLRKTAEPVLSPKCAADSQTNTESKKIECAEEANEIGNTSKSFCSFLKKKLNSTQYQKFKQVLFDVASLRRETRDIIAGKMECIVGELSELFCHVEGFNCEALLNVFGSYIPAELKNDYYRILKSADK